VVLAVSAGQETQQLDTLLQERVLTNLELCVGMKVEEMVTLLEDYTPILEMTFEHADLRKAHVTKGNQRKKGEKKGVNGGGVEGVQSS
jgi:hypothetical protein